MDEPVYCEVAKERSNHQLQPCRGRIIWGWYEVSSVLLHTFHDVSGNDDAGGKTD